MRSFHGEEYSTHKGSSRNSCLVRDEKTVLIEETERLPLGGLYAEEGRPTFEENSGVYLDDSSPLFMRALDRDRLRGLIEEYRGIPG